MKILYYPPPKKIAAKRANDIKDGCGLLLNEGRGQRGSGLETNNTVQRRCVKP